ncbi:hypothetical protein XaplCFBP3122_18990 [Xanthomonas arboricola pv. populi]|uniref:DUF4189 domain-containing protein n=1 Tax=Xanthomonas arboricola pv. populi TaxID=487823 RepID=A0A2S6Z052_9XANT|nr:DUF4189 domain-containing protein [Xanthomonas arboricola]PPT73870.1 hypothetical protein XaplCFBP3122_18990 [Xanthomonas arboricola pv. populi]
MNKFLIVLLLAASPYTIFAQTACPVGVPVGSPQCGPSSLVGGGEISPPPPTASGKWLKTWGAIASAPNGDTGVSSERLSKDDAEEIALKNCSSLSSSGCAIKFVYRNQCVAAANPNSGGEGGVISSAESLDAASARALSKCKNSSGEDCKISLAECSKPFFQKY